jgi:hypothetical protein
VRRLLIAIVVFAGVAACGKSRLDGNAPGAGWDEATADNGFHGDADEGCRHACVRPANLEPPKHAVRTAPPPRVLAIREVHVPSTTIRRGDEPCWIEENEQVRCGVDPASVRTVARARGIDARFLAADDEAFYVVRGGWIARLRFGASTLETIAKTGGRVRDVVLADGFVYWTEQGEPRIVCRADGTMPSCTARDRVTRHPFGSLRRVRIANQHAVMVARDLEAPDGILVVKEQVYVATGAGIVRAAADGSSATLLPTAEPAEGRPALDPVSWTVYVHTRDKLLAVEP